MKVTQMTFEEAMASAGNPNVFRIMFCDDSNYGNRRKHFAARIRPVKSITPAELFGHKDDPKYGFVYIDEIV